MDSGAYSAPSATMIAASRIVGMSPSGASTAPSHAARPLAVIAALLRARALRDDVKVTEASLVEAAHASAEYMIFVTAATFDRAELYRLESGIQDIDATIQRANMIGRYLASEARL